MPVPVTAVANGSIAWEMLEDGKSHFDLVLTDVVMPYLSGVGLLSKMMKREAGKRVPVVSKYPHLPLSLVDVDVGCIHPPVVCW